MKVIFTKTNEVKEVAFGYATNYLLPRGLAVQATPKNIQQLEKAKAHQLEQVQTAQNENRKTINRLKDKVITVKGKVGKNGRLFGAITKKDLAEKLRVEKTSIILDKPIKKAGEYDIKLKFGQEETTVKFVVEGQKDK
jgi:large subunit ribosomal protein L9